MKIILQTKKLTKYYGESLGIKDLSLTIHSGEIFGFLGPNGAGKSTTIRLILHLLKPSAGEINIFDNKVSKNYRQIFKSIGNLPGELKLYEHLSGEYFLDYMSSFFDMESKWRKELLEAFKLDGNVLKKKIKYYSHGMKQKLGVIQALQHDPELIIMDEPTEGLDPLNKTVLYDFLIRFKKLGKTIFFSSHNLSEVERICDRVGLVRSGELVALETIENLKKKMVRRMEIYFAEPYNLEDFKADNIHVIVQKPNQLTINISGDVNPTLKILTKYTIANLVFPEPSLEETFIKYYEH